MINIANNFKIKGQIERILPVGSGIINDTYLVKNRLNNQPDYILQKINSHVFKDPKVLMNNIELVTKEIRNQLLQEGVDNLNDHSIHVIKTLDSKSHFEDGLGNAWRMYNCIPNFRVYDVVPNSEVAYEGAKTFGQFLFRLKDLDPLKIKDTIPKFHNIKWRLEQLSITVKGDILQRKKYAKEELEYVGSVMEAMQTIQNLGEKGSIPLRICHNDTKLNNVLFDFHDKGLCVVDLDTVMQGFMHYDFGDIIRTGANTGTEDDVNLHHIGYDLEIIRAISAGYTDAVSQTITPLERETLPYAVLLLPFIMGLRFLTDYLDGDIYYKINHQEHNLDRAKAQFRLAQDGQTKFDTIKKMLL